MCAPALGSNESPKPQGQMGVSEAVELPPPSSTWAGARCAGVLLIPINGILSIHITEACIISCLHKPAAGAGRELATRDGVPGVSPAWLQQELGDRFPS